MQNSRADSLARSVRKQPSFVVHMDQHLPEWFTEWYEFVVDDKKKYFSFNNIDTRQGIKCFEQFHLFNL